MQRCRACAGSMGDESVRRSRVQAAEGGAAEDGEHSSENAFHTGFDNARVIFTKKPL